MTKILRAVWFCVFTGVPQMSEDMPVDSGKIQVNEYELWDFLPAFGGLWPKCWSGTVTTAVL